MQCGATAAPFRFQPQKSPFSMVRRFAYHCLSAAKYDRSILTLPMTLTIFILINQPSLYACAALDNPSAISAA
jgi:hypothetical protein